MLRSICFVFFLAMTGCVSTGVRTPDYASGLGGTEAVMPFNRAGESSSRQAEIGLLLEKSEIGLEDLLRIAELNNPEVRATRNNVGAAAGRVWQAELYPNPSLEFEAEGIPADEVGLGHSENKVAIVQPLILGGRRSAAISAATSTRDARSLLVQSKLREVQSELHRIHSELVYLKQAIALHSEVAEMAQETLRIARSRSDAKAAPESEAIKAQIDVHELELSRRRLDRLLTASSEQLTSLLGGVQVPLETIGGRLPRELPELDIHRLQVAVREKHPAVLAAEKQVESANHHIDKAKAERIPDIDVRLAYGRDAAAGDDFLEAGIGIPLPLFNRNQGRILESRHLASKAKRDAESLVNNLLSELAMSHASYMAARDEVQTLRGQIVPAAERAFHQAKEGYQAGKIGFLDLLDAQRTLARGQLSLLESVKDMNVSRAKLWKIVGPEIAQ